MSIVHRKNLSALLFILLLNAHCKALGSDLTWEDIKANLNNSSIILEKDLAGDNSTSATVTGNSTLTINGGVSLTNAILEATSKATLNLRGEDTNSVITGSIIAQTGGSVKISDFLNLEGATLSGEGTFSNSGTINLAASKLLSSITNTGTINLTGASLTSNILGTGNLNINNDITISSNIKNKINVANSKTLTYTTGGVLGNTISGGNLIIAGNDLSTNANYLAADTIENNVNLTLTSGTLSKAISGSGNVQFGTNTSDYANLTIDSNVTQNEIAIQRYSTVTLNEGKKLKAEGGY